MTLDLQVKNDCISFGDEFSVRFQRTLRIPDDGKTYPLPPGLGAFQIRRVDDYRDRVPSDWLEHGGVFLPMFQREAMWISFGSLMPHAVKVGIGKVCAITGKPWSETLVDEPQNYLVAPPQPWLDGICVKKGRIRQFVAMPLGMGYTVEGQVTGEERFGGIQIKVFAPKPGKLQRMRARCAAPPPPMACAAPAGYGSVRRSGAMGLGAGGYMTQKIYPDPHGIETWDPTETARVFVHIVNSELWREITGEAAPSTPVTAKEYAKHGFPWFDLYDEHVSALDPTGVFNQVKSIKSIDEEKSTLPLQDDSSVEPSVVKKLYLAAKHLVRDGNW